LDIDKAIADINASYEAALVNYVAGLDTDSSYDIDITGPFFGIEWGIAEGNTQRQRWRWLGPRDQSHLFLKLSTETDHLIRIYIHTATSGQIMEALTAAINGTRCAQQGYNWGGDGALPAHWCLVTRDMVAKQQGIAKITYSLLPAKKGPQVMSMNDASGIRSIRSIAFSQLTCEPYPATTFELPASQDKIGLQQRLKSKLQAALNSK